MTEHSMICRRPDHQGSIVFRQATSNSSCLDAKLGAGLALYLALATIGMSNVDAAETILSLSSHRGQQTMWRRHRTWRSESCRTADGKLVDVDPFRPNKLVDVDGKKKFVMQTLASPLHSEFPSANWTTNDFDDRDWDLRPGIVRYPYHSVAHVALRARFLVDDPANVGDLQLTMAYEGGVVVYLNGKEVARGHMPKGDVKAETLALDYPREAHLSPKGGMLYIQRHSSKRKPKERWQMRSRKLEGVRIPATTLRKGENIFAVSLHRAPAVEEMFTKGFKASGWFKYFAHRIAFAWGRIALLSLSLKADKAAGVTKNLKRPDGIQFWNYSACQAASAYTFSEPRPIYPIRMHAARNGTAWSVVVASGPKALKGLNVEAAPFKGEGGSFSGTTLRYAQYQRLRRGVRFDTLDDSPSEDGDVAPIWFSVRVPPSAKPGLYRSSLKVSAEGAEAKTFPVELTVRNVDMPNPADFKTHIGILQSPTSVAMKYDVPMWSEKHWALLERSFEVLGTVGNKVAYLPLVRRTHFGNEHSMVRWIKQADGSFKHDFSIVEKYLATASKHQPNMPVVCLYLWDFFMNPGFGKGKKVDPSKLGTGGQSTNSTDGKHFTAIDPSTGKLTGFAGPKWDDPKAVEFWKPVIEGVRKIAAKHGLEKSLMFGIAGDGTPSPSVVNGLKTIAADIPWVRHSHWYGKTVGHSRKDKKSTGQPVKYTATVGGAIGVFWEPSTARRPFYGWKNKKLAVVFARDSYGRGPSLGQWANSSVFRTLAEGTLHTGRLIVEKWGTRKDIAGMGGKQSFEQFPGIRGIGRIGGDFWPVLKGPRSSFPIRGRYPETAWGTVSIGSNNTATYVLGAGKQGPVPTVRFEWLRASLQDAEMIILVRNALLDKASRAKLPADLTKRAETHLDHRIRWLRTITEGSGYLGSGYGGSYRLPAKWEAYSRELYEIAEEVVKALKKE